MANDDEIPDDHFVMDLFRSAETMLKQVESAARYPHREGGGAAKEDILRMFLNERLPSLWKLTKGCIKDCLNKTTGEFDIIAFDPTATLLLGKSRDDRIVVPVEAVRLILEVRSRIDKAAIIDTEKQCEQLALLKRFYSPGPLEPETRMVDEWFGKGVPALEQSRHVPSIEVGLVGFDGIQASTIVQHLKDHGRHISYVINLSEYVILHNHIDDPLHLPTGGSSLSFLLREVVRSIEDWNSFCFYLRPNWRKYFLIHDEKGNPIQKVE